MSQVQVDTATEVGATASGYTTFLVHEHLRAGLGATGTSQEGVMLLKDQPRNIEIQLPVQALEPLSAVFNRACRGESGDVMTNDYLQIRVDGERFQVRFLQTRGYPVFGMDRSAIRQWQQFLARLLTALAWPTRSGGSTPAPAEEQR